MIYLMCEVMLTPIVPTSIQSDFQELNEEKTRQIDNMLEKYTETKEKIRHSWHLFHIIIFLFIYIFILMSIHVLMLVLTNNNEQMIGSLKNDIKTYEPVIIWRIFMLIILGLYVYHIRSSKRLFDFILLRKMQNNLNNISLKYYFNWKWILIGCVLITIIYGIICWRVNDKWTLLSWIVFGYNHEDTSGSM